MPLVHFKFGNCQPTARGQVGISIKTKKFYIFFKELLDQKCNQTIYSQFMSISIQAALIYCTECKLVFNANLILHHRNRLNVTPKVSECHEKLQINAALCNEVWPRLQIRIYNIYTLNHTSIFL